MNRRSFLSAVVAAPVGIAAGVALPVWAMPRTVVYTSARASLMVDWAAYQDIQAIVTRDLIREINQRAERDMVRHMLGEVNS